MTKLTFHSKWYYLKMLLKRRVVGLRSLATERRPALAGPGQRPLQPLPQPEDVDAAEDQEARGAHRHAHCSAVVAAHLPFYIPILIRRPVRYIGATNSN